MIRRQLLSGILGVPLLGRFSTDKQLQCSCVPAEYDVRLFGARGDGSTDDTASIQAAFNALPLQGGQIIFPSSSGAYCVTGLTLPARSGPIELLGIGNVTLYSASAGNTLSLVFAEQYAQPIRIRGIEFRGDGIASNNGLLARNLQHLVVMDCRFILHGGNGLDLQRCYAPRIIRSLFQANAYGLSLGQSSANNAVVRDSYLFSNRTAGVYVGAAHLNTLLQGCDLEGNHLGVEIVGNSAGPVAIKDSYFEGSELGAFAIGDPYLTNFVFDGNYVQGSSQTIQNVRMGRICDNHFHDSVLSVGLNTSGLRLRGNSVTGTASVPEEQG